MTKNVLKSVLHNIGVLLVGFVFGGIGVLFDRLFALPESRFGIAIGVGCLLLLIGFLIRLWATYLFYEQKMSVIVLKAQNSLITTGPYRFSRNPLYLGGNLFIFLGAALVLGSPSAVILTVIGLIATNFMIRREEAQLKQKFGTKWDEYKKAVPRWL